MKPIKMIKVDSSNIEAIGFVENVIYGDGFAITNVLRIRYLSGYTFDYLGVSRDTHQDFMDAVSKGSFWHKKIKDKYKEIKVSSPKKD